MHGVDDLMDCRQFVLVLDVGGSGGGAAGWISGVVMGYCSTMPTARLGGLPPVYAHAHAPGNHAGNEVARRRGEARELPGGSAGGGVPGSKGGPGCGGHCRAGKSLLCYLDHDCPRAQASLVSVQPANAAGVRHVILATVDLDRSPFVLRKNGYPIPLISTSSRARADKSSSKTNVCRGVLGGIWGNRRSRLGAA